MKNNLEFKKLAEILKVQNGYAFNSKLFSSDNGIPLIRIRDLKNGYITETNYQGEYDRIYEVNKGDLLIGMDGEFICYEWKGLTALLNQRVCRLQNFNDSLLPKYLLYRINEYLKTIQDSTAYVTVKHISSKQIENIQIPLPSLSEQKRIVAILDEAFAAIYKARANAEKNLANTCEVFDSYLNSVFSSKGVGWEEKTIEEVALVVSGYSFSSKDFSPKNKVKSVKITNVGVQEFVQEDDNYLPELFVSKYCDFKVKKGDIVLALTRTIISNGLKVAIVPKNYDNSLLNQRVAAIKAKEKIINSSFLYSYFCTNIVTKYVLANVNTLMQPNLSINDLKRLPILVPSIEKQKQIVSKLDELSAQTKRLEDIYKLKIADLDELKKSILQKAFEGDL